MCTLTTVSRSLAVEACGVHNSENCASPLCHCCYAFAVSMCHCTSSLCHCVTIPYEKGCHNPPTRSIQLALQHDNMTVNANIWRGGLWAAQVHESLIRPTMGLVLLLQGTAFDWVKVRLGFFANFPHPRRWHSKCNYFSYRDVSIHFCMAADIFWNCLINTVPSLVCCNDLEACEQLSIMRGYNLLLTASNTRYPCLSKQQNPASFLNP